MEILKIIFDYKCFPVWIYNEKDQLITNDLPEYLIGDEKIDPMFVNLQERYDNLYVDDDKEFKFKGFASEDDEKKFLENVSDAVDLLKQKVNKSTIVEFDKNNLIKMLH